MRLPASLPALTRGDVIAIAMIVAGNVLTLVVALQQRWPVLLMLWPFWVQSLIVGWYAVRRMVALRRFVYQDKVVAEDAPAGARAVKWVMAGFFVVHYGLFHLGYLFFLGVFTMTAAESTATQPSIFGHVETGDVWLAIGSGLVFIIGHALAFRRARAIDARGAPDVSALMALPYLRVFPMHALIILGAVIGAGPLGLVVFTALKTAADVAMQLNEQRLAAKSAIATTAPAPIADRSVQARGTDAT